jgi:hypothetical protein
MLSLSIAVEAAAGVFDGNRKGFIFAGGIGFGVTRYASSNEIVSGHGYPSTVVFNWRVGYAPSDELQIYYAMRQSVFIPRIVNNYGDYFDEIGKKSLKGTLYLLVAPFVVPLIPFFSEQHLMPAGLGVRRYFGSQAPSLYADLGVGAMASSFPYEDEEFPLVKPPHEMDVAFGVFGGFGWEWKRHVSLEAQLMWTHATRSNNHLYENYPLPLTHDKYDALSLMLTISLCGY